MGRIIECLIGPYIEREILDSCQQKELQVFQPGAPLYSTGLVAIYSLLDFSSASLVVPIA